MKTVTKNGQVYQCDKIYVCVHTGKVCRISENQISNSLYPKVYWGESDWVCLHDLDLLHADEIGAITPAPIIPKNGNWYRVQLGHCTTALFMRNNQWYDSEEGTVDLIVTKILSKLTVETK